MLTSSNESVIFFHNLAYDPHHTLDGLPCIQCIFCDVATPIESDMRFHLSNMHKKDLVIRLPLYGKGYNMGYRKAIAMNVINERQKTQQILYDHNTATFASAFSPQSNIRRGRDEMRCWNGLRLARVK